MRFQMKMPDLAATESEIRIVRWLIQPGEKIERGQPIVEVETDKATVEVESAVSGVLEEVRSQADEVVSVGDVIAVLEVAAATRESFAADPVPAPEPTTPATRSPASAAPSVQTTRGPACGPGGMFARTRAVLDAPAAPNETVSLSIAQRTAARRLQESKQTVPHFYVQTSANASGIVARRKAAEPVKLAWDAFFVLAVARAIGRFDRFRCRIEGKRLAPIESDAIGVAVDEQGDLYVIPIASAAAKTVEQISDEIRGGLDGVRSGDPEARRIRPALMTVTNLGICNVESFIPIINPPEAAILGVGRVMPVPVARDDGRIGVEHRCTLTLSVDHRVASGRQAGQFLGEIVHELESLGGDAK
jgi:pyruvate dehydrogenase E2 component (dihydrolipoamide acetyltransferase)